MLCPVHPFATTWHFPSRGNERYEGKNGESYTSRTISAFSPFGVWRYHLSPASGGTITRAYCRAAYEERPRGVLFCPPKQGEVRRSRIGGGERSEPITRMRIMPYDTESQSCNVLASPLGEEGHEVAKGWTRVRMIMILDVDVTAAGGL